MSKFIRLLLLLLAPGLNAQMQYPAQFTVHGPGGGGYMYSPSMSHHQTSQLFLTCDMGGFYQSQDTGKHWVMADNHELVSTVKGKVQFTSDPNLMYVCRRSRTNLNDPLLRGELAKSTDGGVSWQSMADPTDSGVHRLEADPQSTQRMLLNEYNRLFFTNNGGNSWTEVFHPSDDQMWLGGVFWDGDHIYVGTNKGLLVSHDGGQQFNLESHSGLGGAQGIMHLAGAKNGATTRLFIITAVASELFAWLEVLDLRPHILGFYRMNYLASAPWVNSRGNIPASVRITGVDLAKNNIQTVWVTGEEGGLPLVYKSVNGGQNWTNTFLAAENQNVQTGWGGDYGAFSYLWSGAALGLDVADNDPNRVLTTDGFGHITLDGGASWTAIYVAPEYQNAAGMPTPIAKPYKSSGLDVTTTHQLFWPGNGGLYAANTDIGLTYTEDNGQGWTFERNTFYPWGTLANPNWYRMVKRPDNQHLYAALSEVNDMYLGYRITDDQVTGGGLVVRSTDQGAHWDTMFNFGKPVVWLEIDPQNPNRMYASVVDSANGGIYRTNNGGVTWSRLPAPPRTEGRPYNIRILQDGTLVVSYSARAESDGQTLRPVSGIFYSTDGGQTWQDRTDNAMQWYTKDLIIDPHDPAQNTWYACVWGRFTVFQGPNNAGNGGWYRTKDRGLTWTRIWANESAESMTIHPTEPGIAYFTAENDGLYFTSNLQTSQPDLERVLTYPWWRPKRVFFDPEHSCRVWVTTMGGGIWKGDMGPGEVQWNDIQANVNGFVVTFAPQALNAQTYSWDFGDGTPISTDAFPVHQYAAPGVYTVTCVARNGCSERSFQEQISIQCAGFALSLEMVGNAGICSGEPAFLQATMGYAFYEWHYNGASQGVFPTSSWWAANTGTYWVRVQDSLGCVGTSNSIIVQALAAPDPSFSVALNGYTATFLNQSLNADAYLWDFGDSSPQETTQHPVHQYPGPGSYTVQLTAISAACGEVTETFLVNVVCVNPLVSITAAGSTQICEGQETSLLAQGNGQYQYQWYLNNILITGADGPLWEATEAGVYSVEATDDFGCSGISNTITVEVAALPIAGITALVNPVCEGETTWLTGSGGVAYQWVNPAGDTLDVQVLEWNMVTVSDAGWYQLTVTNGSGCADTVSTWLVVQPSPQVAVLPAGPITITYGDTLILQASAGFSAYLWNNGYTTPAIQVLDCGYYAVTVTDVHGCTAVQEQIAVSVLPVISYSNGVLLASPADVYQWTLNGQDIPGADQQQFIPSLSGNYTVKTFCDPIGWLESDTISVIIAGVISPENNLIQVYPNPVSKEESCCMVRREAAWSGILQWRLLDWLGRLLWQGELDTSGEFVRIPLGDAPAGVYLLQCWSDGSLLGAARLLRQ
ncbi:MAG TPA: PKD domain-containing protein [Saprospiraceae bacterium]|nr:PKD domain-containing protein [Saprospiraceae bacterium]